MRTVALFLMLALSGLPSAAAAAFEGATAALDACGGCPGEASETPESEEERCSPVCHDCVCSFGARTTQPSLVLLAAPELLCTVDVGPTLSKRADPPREPALDGVFHPPKQ